MKKLKFIICSIFVLLAFIAFTYIRHSENTSYQVGQEKIVNKNTVRIQQGNVKAEQDTIKTIPDTLKTIRDTLEAELGTFIITQRTIKIKQDTIIVRDTVQVIEALQEQHQPGRVNIKETEVEDRIIIIGNKKIEIKGSLSFVQIEQLTGVPASFLIKKLKLPAEISRTKNLGSLVRVYGFEMQDVRKYIREYLKIKTLANF